MGTLNAMSKQKKKIKYFSFLTPEEFGNKSAAI